MTLVSSVGAFPPPPRLHRGKGGGEKKTPAPTPLRKKREGGKKTAFFLSVGALCSPFSRWRNRKGEPLIGSTKIKGREKRKGEKSRSALNDRQEDQRAYAASRQPKRRERGVVTGKEKTRPNHDNERKYAANAIDQV